MTIDDKNFFMDRNNVRMTTCKTCLMQDIDNWDPDTFKPLIEKLDFPYIKDEWDNLLRKYVNDPEKVLSSTIVGKYLGKMRMAQFKGKTWADTPKYEGKISPAKRNQLIADGYTQLEIDNYTNNPKLFSVEKPDLKAIREAQQTPEEEIKKETDELLASLSPDDITYLKLKWGRDYRADEWVRLEQLYNDMMDSYDIQGAGTKDMLILICKASLKANQCIDDGDLESFQKVSRTYDTLMKSANLTAAQRKSNKGDEIDCVGELVALCEKEGFIPRFYTPGPQDKVDRTLEDLQHYTKNLVMEELNLGSMIESSLREIAKDKEREADANADDLEPDEEASLEEALFGDDSENKIFNDEDLADFHEREAQMAQEDEELLKGE